MAEYKIQGETLTDIADAIREQTGTSEPVQTSRMSNMIRGIQTGGSDDLFLVTVDWDTNTASHTPAEIAAAAEANKLVFTQWMGTMIKLCSADSGSAWFNTVADNDPLVALHVFVNADKTVETHFGEAKVAIPTFDLTAMGMPAVPFPVGEMFWEHDCSDLTNALLAGPVKVKCRVLLSSGTTKSMECIVTGVASMEGEFVQVTIPGITENGNRVIVSANVFMSGIGVYVGTLGGLEIDTVDMGLTLTESWQHREMTEAAYEQLQAIAAAGPVRLRWQVNFGTASDPLFVDFGTELTPVFFTSPFDENITFSVPEGQYSYYISFTRDDNGCRVGYQVYRHGAS